jgi:phospholipid/cholesterol/gamma-HCH transport system ATP-binding protein
MQENFNPTSTPPAILAQNVWKSYGKAPILKGLNLVLPQGKTLIILGRSGVGKSVLLRQILGIERPDEGIIEIDGVPITSMSKQEIYTLMTHIGMLFQGSALFDSMNVGENVAFYLKQHGDKKTNQNMSESELNDRVHTALKKVGLEGFEKKMPSELSGGQKRRAALARLIIYEPKIILYDEPTTGLDPITSMQINELIAQTQEELHSTSIVVTHDINSALDVGNLFCLHHDGKLHFVSDKEDFIKNDDPLIRDFLMNAMIPEKYTTIITDKKSEPKENDYA